MKVRLSDKQWETVNFINDALRQEYRVRREMVLKRLDVTIQSFRWSDRAKVSYIVIFIDCYTLLITGFFLLLLT